METEVPLGWNKNNRIKENHSSERAAQGLKCTPQPLGTDGQCCLPLAHGNEIPEQDEIGVCSHQRHFRGLTCHRGSSRPLKPAALWPVVMPRSLGNGYCSKMALFLCFGFCPKARLFYTGRHWGGPGKTERGKQLIPFTVRCSHAEARWTGPEGGHRQAASATKSTAPQLQKNQQGTGGINNA
eukprot:bmy_07491T0